MRVCRYQWIFRTAKRSCFRKLPFMGQIWVQKRAAGGRRSPASGYGAQAQSAPGPRRVRLAAAGGCWATAWRKRRPESGASRGSRPREWRRRRGMAPERPCSEADTGSLIAGSATNYGVRNRFVRQGGGGGGCGGGG